MTSNNFQSLCIKRCNDLFGELPNVESCNFEKVIGRKETYFRAMVRGAQHVIEVYIYEDEAGFMLEGGKWTIFEKPDYPSEDELLQAFLIALRETLGSSTNPP